MYVREMRSCRMEETGGIMTLEAFFKEVPRAAAAFSGGADSAFLLWAAKQYGCSLHAYYIRTQFQPDFELEDARRLADMLKIPLHIIPMDILAVPEAAANGIRRCYYCKHAIFSRIREEAYKDGFTVLLDGTNGSDAEDDRPGMQALRELEVRSPLRECGLTKEEIRRLSREAGLFTWNKPAYACLATRVPAGTRITGALLEKAAWSEEQLHALGFSDFRIRLTDAGARLQVTAGQMALAVEKRETILDVLKPVFSNVVLDLEARRPSV